MNLDRLTLLLMIAVQTARLSTAGPAVVGCLIALVMVRMGFAYDPRRLARVVQEFAARSNTLR